MKIVTDFILLGSKITVDGDCSHEIKRCLLLGRKYMTILDSVLESRDITLLTKDHVVKAIVFPVVMYGLVLKFQYFGHLMLRVNSLEKTLMLGKIGGTRRRGCQRMRWLDGITDTMDMSQQLNNQNQNFKFTHCLSVTPFIIQIYCVPTECSIVKGCSLQHSVPFKTPAKHYYLPCLSTVIKYIHQNTHTHTANTNTFSILHNYPYYLCLKHFHHPQNKTGFQGAATCKESACQCRKHKRYGFDPWVGKIPWRRA